MGIGIENTTALGVGFHRRLSALRPDSLFEIADLLRVDTSDCPDTDMYDWLRQRIYDELQDEGRA